MGKKMYRTIKENGKTKQELVEEIWTGIKTKFYVLTAAMPENFWGYTEHFTEEGKLLKTEAFLGKRQFLPNFRDYMSGMYPKQEAVKN